MDSPITLHIPPLQALPVRLTLPFTLSALIAIAIGVAQASAAPSSPKKAKPPAQYAASADQPTIRYVDPATGKPIWTGQASSSSGGPGGASGSVVLTMKNVHGTFYQNGSPVDRMNAPTVAALQQSGMTKVTASGGVTVQSISQPDSSMRCDTAVWSSATNQILGTGHVLLKKRGFTQQGSSILIDSKLRTALMPAPNMGGGAGVHAHFQSARPLAHR